MYGGTHIYRVRFLWLIQRQSTDMALQVGTHAPYVQSKIFSMISNGDSYLATEIDRVWVQHHNHAPLQCWKLSGAVEHQP